uniref:Uncharacterized protein n=1 Tax=Zea mays TaxID=4577 RepID=C0PGT0_MAIZE|nr:unknown [Zea mays]ACR34813.1 unknown [Zea mays]
MEAFCSLIPPARHFLKPVIDSLADSNTRVSSFVRRGTNLGTVIMEELWDLLRTSLYLLVNAYRKNRPMLLSLTKGTILHPSS